MSYKLAYQCKHCKHVFGQYVAGVYRLDFTNRKNICPKCGEIDYIDSVVAKRKFLHGWNVKSKVVVKN